MWPAVAVGAFVVNVTLGPSILPVLAIAAGNTIAPICACLLLRRAGFRPALDRLHDALALVFLGALGGMVISSTIGTGVLVAAGALPAGDFWATWSVWWTGDAMGVLFIAPLLLAARTARLPRGSPVLRGAVALLPSPRAHPGPTRLRHGRTESRRTRLQMTPETCADPRRRTTAGTITAVEPVEPVEPSAVSCPLGYFPTD